MQAKSKLPGWCQLVLFGLCAMLAVTKVQAVHIGQDATPDDNDVLIDEISFQIGALDAAVVEPRHPLLAEHRGLAMPPRQSNTLPISH